MKFGQLIEHNMWNIFLKKSYTKYGGETILRLFSKRAKLSVSLDHLSKQSFEHFVVIVYKVVDYQNLLLLSYRPLAFSLHKVFLEKKKKSGTIHPTSFSAWFLKKNISLAIFYNLP